jgi:hypothetical protein
MDTLESTTQSFIVKVWIEESSDGTTIAWHGHITHVSDGERRYVKSLMEVRDFIVPYLVDMGVKPSIGWRIRHCLKRLTKRG